jgi:hypothetical protein
MDEINWTKLWIGIVAIVGLTVVGSICAVEIPDYLTAQIAMGKGYIQQVERAQTYNKSDYVIWIKDPNNPTPPNDAPAHR